MWLLLSTSHNYQYRNMYRAVLNLEGAGHVRGQVEVANLQLPFGCSCEIGGTGSGSVARGAGNDCMRARYVDTA